MNAAPPPNADYLPLIPLLLAAIVGTVVGWWHRQRLEGDEPWAPVFVVAIAFAAPLAAAAGLGADWLEWRLGNPVTVASMRAQGYTVNEVTTSPGTYEARLRTRGRSVLHRFREPTYAWDVERGVPYALGDAVIAGVCAAVVSRVRPKVPTPGGFQLIGPGPAADPVDAREEQQDEPRPS